ncbi:hypothetical protein KGM_207934 [Danaus plexippus plexippus]|uniref:Uncharacterized protein n=1 Tax=Danaus plexippus plexippus TaxID=278856 RepID=A0A212EV64_DANPL|nr:hypothetical protein KGM_207934 [Danaus plexippus plexippus]
MMLFYLKPNGLRNKSDVERLEVLQQYAERQQWDERWQPAHRSHDGSTDWPRLLAGWLGWLAGLARLARLAPLIAGWLRGSRPRRAACLTVLAAHYATQLTDLPYV